MFTNIIGHSWAQLVKICLIYKQIIIYIKSQYWQTKTKIKYPAYSSFNFILFQLQIYKVEICNKLQKILMKKQVDVKSYYVYTIVTHFPSPQLPAQINTSRRSSSNMRTYLFYSEFQIPMTLS